MVAVFAEPVAVSPTTRMTLLSVSGREREVG